MRRLRHQLCAAVHYHHFHYHHFHYHHFHYHHFHYADPR